MATFATKPNDRLSEAFWASSAKSDGLIGKKEATESTAVFSDAPSPPVPVKLLVRPTPNASKLAPQQEPNVAQTTTKSDLRRPWAERFAEQLEIERWAFFGDRWWLYPCVVAVVVFGIVFPGMNIAFYLHEPKGFPALPDVGFRLLPHIDRGDGNPNILARVALFFHESIPLIMAATTISLVVATFFRLIDNVHTSRVPLIFTSPTTGFQTRVLAKVRQRTTLVSVSARFGMVISICLSLRVVTFLSTVLPGPAPHCHPDALSEVEGFSSWADVFSTIRPTDNCGDLVFSGHMAMTFLLAMTASHYFPFSRKFVWPFVVLEAFLIVITRSHYTLDVVIALYVAPFLWFLLEYCAPDYLYSPVDPLPEGFSAVRSTTAIHKPIVGPCPQTPAAVQTAEEKNSESPVAGRPAWPGWVVAWPRGKRASPRRSAAFALQAASSAASAAAIAANAARAAAEALNRGFFRRQHRRRGETPREEEEDEEEDETVDDSSDSPSLQDLTPLSIGAPPAQERDADESSLGSTDEEDESDEGSPRASDSDVDVACFPDFDADSSPAPPDSSPAPNLEDSDNSENS